MRLIDADALAKVKFHGYQEIEITPSDVNAESYKRGWNDAIDAIIENTPSVERKKGKWIDEGIAFVCSECGIGSDQWTNYCPSCGARMEDDHET